MKIRSWYDGKNTLVIQINVFETKEFTFSTAILYLLDEDDTRYYHQRIFLHSMNSEEVQGNLIKWKFHSTYKTESQEAWWKCGKSFYCVQMRVVRRKGVMVEEDKRKSSCKSRVDITAPLVKKYKIQYE